MLIGAVWFRAPAGIAGISGITVFTGITSTAALKARSIGAFAIT